MLYYNLGINFIQSVLIRFLRLDKIYLTTDKAVVFHYNLKNHSFKIVVFRYFFTKLLKGSELSKRSTCNLFAFTIAIILKYIKCGLIPNL